MHRLTEKYGRGNWCLKGVPWESLREGQVITKTMCEKLYGVLCKLKDYEDTELAPDDVKRVNDFGKSEIKKLMIKLEAERQKHRWIPVEERLPDTDDYILISFENFSIPQVGRYEEDEAGGAFYLGDEEESCISQDLVVNAWRPLPKPYRG